MFARSNARTLQEALDSCRHVAHLSQIAEAMPRAIAEAAEAAEAEAKAEAAKAEEAGAAEAEEIGTVDAIKAISRAHDILEARKDRSAWDRGVTLYAHELLDDLVTAIMGGYLHSDDIATPKTVARAMLNSADSWDTYSYGGCSLIYNDEIAARLCCPSELRRTRNGARKPNPWETWLDIQARALCQAAARAQRAIADATEEVL